MLTTEHSDPAIHFEATTKSYGSVMALDKLNLKVYPGELFGFLGLNGAGKTTAMKLASGLVKPTMGQVYICGWNIQTDPKPAKRLVGFVPESPYLYDSLTGREFLHFCAGLYQMSHGETVQQVGRLSEMFGIGTWIDKRTGEYSHGMKQRVTMASAFLHKPKVILIDEPMVGLDPGGMRLVKKVLREFCETGGAVFLSTHTLIDAEQLCTRVGIVHHGRMVVCGTQEEIRNEGQSLEERFLEITEGAIG